MSPLLFDACRLILALLGVIALFLLVLPPYIKANSPTTLHVATLNPEVRYCGEATADCGHLDRIAQLSIDLGISERVVTILEDNAAESEKFIKALVSSGHEHDKAVAAKITRLEENLSAVNAGSLQPPEGTTLMATVIAGRLVYSYNG